MRIATYNFCLGGKPDYQTLYRVLHKLEPDILLAQEADSPPKYLSRNTEYWAARDPPTYEWKSTDHTYWGSAIYTRLGKIDRILSLPRSLLGWVVGVELSGVAYPDNRGLPLRILSIHTPTRVPRDYCAELTIIVKAIDEMDKECALVVGGDFNVTVGTRHPSESYPNVEQEQVVIAKLQDLGLISCWQVAHPDLPLDQTYHGGVDTATHIDGIFVPRTWQKHLRRCEVVSPPRHQWSEGDHYPVLADFDIAVEEPPA